mgnify:FL=1
MRLVRTAVLLLALAAAAGAVEPPREWLLLAPIDARGRQPFNPDRVFLRHLLDRDAPPPREGEELGGATWSRAAADGEGAVGGDIAYAYAALESDRDRIVLVRVPGAATLFVNGDAFVGDVYGMGHGGVPVLLRRGTNHLYVRGVRGRFRLQLEAVEEGVHRSDRDVTRPTLGSTAAFVTVNASREPREGHLPLGVRKSVREPSEPVPPRPGEAQRIAFESSIDGSLQEYSVLAPEHEEGAGIVLSLHGAGVDAYDQARSYSRKKDLWIVAPTNRRPFGFDWQDWGRADAYEVLAHALTWTGADPRRVYLTGHSMGGHGTWHLAANDPDRFLAIAPSAGWCSFDTYTGRPPAAREEPWRGADGASLTLDPVDNLAALPTFILHGEKDDNVPLSEARRMEAALRVSGGAPEVHAQAGAGHWWDGGAAPGADCVDWPGIFDLFGRTPPRPAPDALSFVTVDPGVDAVHHWVAVLQPLAYGRPARVRARRAGDTVEVETVNVRRMRVDAEAELFVLDGRPLPAPALTTFLKTDAGWTVASPAAGEKSPERCGPFKRAFANRFVFVYGAGDAEGMARARYEQQVWWYRANGDVEAVDDATFLRDGYAGRNVILFGNASVNRAFARVLPADCPVHVREGAIRAGRRSWAGDDLGCLFVVPRAGDPAALVGVFGATGARGARLGYALLPFVSGVGYPDYVVFGPSVLERGTEAAAAAGWFDHAWRLD